MRLPDKGASRHNWPPENVPRYLVDIKSLKNGHKGNNRVKSKRRDLKSIISEEIERKWILETDEKTYSIEVYNRPAHRKKLTHQEDVQNEAWTLGSKVPDPDTMSS